MLLALSLLAGCSNLTFDQWSGGGARYATGVANVSASDTAVDTGSTEGAPVLEGGTVQLSPDEVGHDYLHAGVRYSDDPDDVAGGHLYYTANPGGESGSRPIIDGSTYDEASEAGVADGNIQFVSDAVASTTTSVTLYVVDYTHNTSNSVTLSITDL